MSLLDAYRQKLEIQIQEHKARLDLLRARAKHAIAQSEIELAQADKHLQKARVKFNELKGASGHALNEISLGVKNALNDLRTSTQKAARHFNAPPAPRKKRPVKARARAKTAAGHATKS